MARRLIGKRLRLFARRLQLQSVGPPSRAQRRRSRRIRKSSNHWIHHPPMTYSKVALSAIEREWLVEFAPNAVVEYRKVHNCENMTLYRQNRWNGYAHFVTFSEDAKTEMQTFRLTWWTKQ